MNTRIFIVSFVGVGVSLVYGQQGSIAGPTAGFVFDGSSHVLRGIRGIPGAALIGDPVDFGVQPAWVSVSPALDSAVVADTTGVIHLFGLTGGKPVERSVDGLAHSQNAVYSPSGTAAALYGAGSVQMLKGLPDSPVIGGTLSLGQDLSSQFAAASLGKTRRSTGEPLAVSDDGSYVLLVSGGSLRVLGTAGDNRRLMDVTAGALAAFAPGGHDVGVVDVAAGLSLLHDIAGSAVQQVLAGPDAHIGLPVAIAFSPDAKRIFVASAAARNVASFDAATGAFTTLACDCTPAGLVLMGSAFRLNELGSGPIWLLDARTTEPHLVFVPALH